MKGLHNLSPAPGSTHADKRIGRGPGSGQGKTAGRGNKGMWSRSGSHSKRGFEGGQMPLHRRLPKRGFSNQPFKKEWSELNVSELQRLDFAAGSSVGPDELVAKKVFRRMAKDGLRILGDGKLEKALTVRAHHFTAGAREKITKAGGTCEVIAS